MKDTPENAVKVEVKGALDFIGAFHFPLLQGVASYKGLPDRIAAFEGQCWAIECKRPGGKLSSHQIDFKEQWEGAGLPWLTATSAEDVFRAFGFVQTRIGAWRKP